MYKNLKHILCISLSLSIFISNNASNNLQVRSSKRDSQRFVQKTLVSVAVIGTLIKVSHMWITRSQRQTYDSLIDALEIDIEDEEKKTKKEHFEDVSLSGLLFYNPRLVAAQRDHGSIREKSISVHDFPGNYVNFRSHGDLKDSAQMLKDWITSIRDGAKYTQPGTDQSEYLLQNRKRRKNHMIRYSDRLLTKRSLDRSVSLDPLAHLSEEEFCVKWNAGRNADRNDPKAYLNHLGDFREWKNAKKKRKKNMEDDMTLHPDNQKFSHLHKFFKRDFPHGDTEPTYDEYRTHTYDKKYYYLDRNRQEQRVERRLLDRLKHSIEWDCKKITIDGDTVNAINFAEFERWLPKTNSTN